MPQHTFVLSDETVNSHGFWVKTEGIDLTEFEKNPVMLYAHDNWSMPIGRWENIRKENGQLLADAVFDENDEQGKKIAQKIKDGFIKACSIGLTVKELSEEELKQGQTRATVTKCSIFETSIVNIGSNSNALKLHFNGGVTLSGEIDPVILSQQIPTLNTDIKMKKVIAHLGLNENATEEEILSAIEAKEQQPETVEVEAILAYGEEKGIVTENNKESYKALAEKDPKAVLGLFQKSDTPSVFDINAHLEHGNEGCEESRDNWTLSQWKEKDYPGLLKLKETDNKKYNQLFKS